jgi:hypothetical protein
MNRMFTVWRFESPTSGEVRIVPRVAEFDELRYVHHYQQVLWRGLASSKLEALGFAGYKQQEAAE